MIIDSSDQVPRKTLLKRFPVPRNFGLAPGSRIGRGKAWPLPAGAKRVKRFEIYRYGPDSGRNPRLDTFEVDLDDRHDPGVDLPVPSRGAGPAG